VTDIVSMLHKTSHSKNLL